MISFSSSPSPSPSPSNSNSNSKKNVPSSSSSSSFTSSVSPSNQPSIAPHSLVTQHLKHQQQQQQQQLQHNQQQKQLQLQLHQLAQLQQHLTQNMPSSPSFPIFPNSFHFTSAVSASSTPVRSSHSTDPLISVLVVDDSLLNRKLIVKLLEKFNSNSASSLTGGISTGPDDLPPPLPQAAHPSSHPSSNHSPHTPTNIQQQHLKSLRCVCDQAEDGKKAVELVQANLSANGLLLLSDSHSLNSSHQSSHNSSFSANSNPPMSQQQPNHAKVLTAASQFLQQLVRVGSTSSHIASPSHVPSSFRSRPDNDRDSLLDELSKRIPLDAPENEELSLRIQMSQKNAQLQGDLENQQSSPANPPRPDSSSQLSSPSKAQQPENRKNSRISPVPSSFASTSAPPLYDVILMDYQMPRMDGVEAIRQIRSLGFKGLVLGLTGNALQSDQNRMMEVGADGVLTKPVDVDRLRGYLRGVKKEKLSAILSSSQS